MTTATSSLTIEQTDETRNGLPARWTVKRDGRLIGLVEQFRKNAIQDNAYRAYYLAKPGHLDLFEKFRGTNGLQDAAEAIARKFCES